MNKLSETSWSLFLLATLYQTFTLQWQILEFYHIYKGKHVKHLLIYTVLALNYTHLKTLWHDHVCLKANTTKLLWQCLMIMSDLRYHVVVDHLSGSPRWPMDCGDTQGHQVEFLLRLWRRKREDSLFTQVVVNWCLNSVAGSSVHQERRTSHEWFDSRLLWRFNFE